MTKMAVPPEVASSVLLILAHGSAGSPEAPRPNTWQAQARAEDRAGKRQADPAGGAPQLDALFHAKRRFSSKATASGYSQPDGLGRASRPTPRFAPIGWGHSKSTRTYSEMESKKRASRSGIFRLVLSPNRRAGSRARQAVRQRFSETLPSVTLGDLFSVVTELVNNSVQHGPGKPITLTLVMSGESIRGEVADQGNPDTAIPEIKEVTKTGGRGLAVVDKLTAQWGVYEGSTHVWFEMPLDH
jgi:anti-sigma regulatory factor (Ser/Thr protein kinase)